MTRVRKTTTVVAAAVLLAAGCTAKATEPYNDAPRSGTENSTPADVVTFPDGFSNVASKCDGPNRVYVAFHADAPYAALAVVPGDPRCKQ
jgi:PBP1b-binding outer membrane lipoprotein LpoB